MKRYCFLFAFFLLPFAHFAQHFNEPEGYLDFINDHHREIAKEIVFYTNSLAHGKNARKEEPVRKSILHKLKSASFRIGGMPSYKSDKSLQDSLVSYTRATYAILHDEYPKVLSAQDSAKNSHEASISYWKAKDDALALLLKDEEKFNNAVKAFASQYKVDISGNHEDEWEQLKTIREVSAYHQAAYLIYFKCEKKESELVKSVTAKNVTDMQAHTATLFNYVKQGLVSVDSLKEYKGDASLYTATKQLLEFYQKECEFKMPSLITYHLKEESYAKLKKDQAGKSDTAMSLEDKEQMIKATNEYNDLKTTYPVILQELGEERPKLVANWNKAAQAFLKKQLP